MNMDKRISSWKIIYNNFSPKEESLREALCTLGNGYMATRGAAPESDASEIHYPGTYIAGIYNKLATRIAGKIIYNEDMVNCPNWLPLTFRIGEGDWINFRTCKVKKYYLELDMQKGLLVRNAILQDKDGRRTRIETQRIVHMADPHRAAMVYTIIPENYEDWIVIKSALDGTVQNKGVARYRDLNSDHLSAHAMGSFSKKGLYLSVTTNQSYIEICQASKIRILNAGHEIKTEREILTKERKKIFQEFRIYAKKGQRYRIEKIVSIFTSRDKKTHNPLAKAIDCVKNSPGFDSLMRSHKRAWAQLWNKFDIKIRGDVFSQQLIRFHIFHLLQIASVHNINIDAGLPARGLHGESYRGHIFWDELFILHLFDLHAPEISRSFLMYRYRRLTEAKKYAQEYGYKGAMFPWQSGSTGEEETQTIHLNPKSGRWFPDYSRNQRHVSFAIAYNIWQYWNRTHDIDFLIHYGAEMLLEIARFGASLTQYDHKDNKYHTEGLMGPDEFHEIMPGASKPGFRDNAYTNLLIAWTLLKARRLLNILPEKQRKHVSKKIGLKQEELRRWKDITKKINLPMNQDGIISQFDGYFTLKELNWLLYKVKYRNIRRLDRILEAEGLSPSEYKVAKQADALMIFYLLPITEVKELFNNLRCSFDTELLVKNYKYYIKRTSHGSTLSKVTHCYISHLLGNYNESWRWFINVLKSDINDTQGGTTPEGIHAGVMGGSIDIVIRGFAGIEILDEKIKIHPRLPKGWREIKFRLLFRGHWIIFAITNQKITIFIFGKRPKPFETPIQVGHKLYYLSTRKTYRIPLR
jgi:trehalose/maltose hydrolase-like predicted phosphorylase